MTTFHICHFSTTGDLRGKLLTYENLKRVVLGGRPVLGLEATETQKRARLFGRLCKDPEVEVEPLTFPWTAVRKRGAGDL